MLSALEWLSVEQHLKYFVLIFIHKIKIDLVPDYFKNILVSFENVHTHDTRNKQNFILNQVNTNQARNSVFLRD